MKKITYLLKKDLPTIKAGRVIELSKDGKSGTPMLMNIEKNNYAQYVFPIHVLKTEKDWFELFEHNANDKIKMCE